MMVAQAVVIGYQNGVARVQCFAKSACGGCAVQSGCGTKALSSLAGEKVAPQFSLEVSQPLAVGDKIEIGLAKGHLLRGVMWLYAIPLAVLVLSSLLFSQWTANEGIVALGMLISTLGAFLGVNRRLARQQLAQFTPFFLRKI